MYSPTRARSVNLGSEFGETGAQLVTISGRQNELQLCGSKYYIPSTTMPQGQAIPESIQWIIIRLSTAMSIDEICGYTDISNRKVRDILAHFKKTGDVNIPKHQRPTIHISLQDEDIQVSFTLY